MSKIARQTMQTFGANSGTNQIEQFGSLAGGVPNYTTNIATIQALSAWLEGWFGAVVGADLPAIEDLNAVCYVFAYQLAYLFQSGIAEWDAGTTYFKGSIVTAVGTGVMYVSLTDNNTNNAVTTTNWVQVGSTNVVDVTAAGGTTALAASDNGKTIIVDTTSAAQTYTLPAPVLNYRIKIKDGGHAQTHNITINPHASETIDGLSTIVMTFNYGWIELVSDGTNWFIVDQSQNRTPWTAYTPSSIIGFGTTTANNFLWRRSGDTMEVQGNFGCGVIPGSTIGSVSTPFGVTGTDNRGGSFWTSKAGAFSVTPQLSAGSVVFPYQDASIPSVPVTASSTNYVANSSSVAFWCASAINGWTNY